jgi:hypothetical protein
MSMIANVATRAMNAGLARTVDIAELHCGHVHPVNPSLSLILAHRYVMIISHTIRQRRVRLRRIQRKPQIRIRLQKPRSPWRVPSAVIPNHQRIRRRRQGLGLVGLLITKDIPHHLGRGARYHAIRRSHGIRVPVLVAHCAHG